MADERVQAAIRHWAARFIANGIDYNDFVRTTAAIDRWDEWLPAWTATAETHLALAEQARARGAERSAGEAYLRAAVSYHFSKFVWVVDPERNRRNTEAAVRALYAAHERLDPTAQRIEATGAVATLRLPARRAAGSAGRADPGPGLHQGGVLSLGVGVPGPGDGDPVHGWPRAGRDRLAHGHPPGLRAGGVRGP